MSSLYTSPLDHLGHATERLLGEAFAKTATITAARAAEVLGLDEKTLRGAAQAGLIGSIPTGGGLRRYTEADLRAYLGRPRETPAQKEPAPCPSTNRQRVASGNLTLSFVGRATTAAPGKLRDAPLRGRKTASAGKSRKADSAAPTA